MPCLYRKGVCLVPSYDLGIPETAARLHVSHQSVVRWITTGVGLRDGKRARLAAVKLGGSWRTSAEAVDAFVALITADAITADAQRD